MSVNAMKPNFTDRTSYLAWRRTWKLVYMRLSETIRHRKMLVRDEQRYSDSAARGQKELHLMRRDAAKMMTLLKDAKVRREHILKMQRDIAAQPFPLDLGECSTIDFHYNRIANEYVFMPNWVVKAKGKSYYVRDFESHVGFSTRNRDTGSTRGMLRFKKASLSISQEGIATIA